ncbi:MAG: peptidoglycan-binding protein [Pseudomonadota bacterium]
MSSGKFVVVDLCVSPRRAVAFVRLALAAATSVIVVAPLIGAPANAAVFGRDDRQPVPKGLKQLSQQIGRLYNPSIGTNCTAFCVAPNVIATAAHCLFRKPKSGTLRMSDFRFAVGTGAAARQSPIDGAAVKSAGQHIITGTTRLRVRPPIDAGSDWALMRTQDNICAGHELPVHVKSMREIERASDRGDMFQVAYHSDYDDWELAYSHPCKVRAEFPELSARTIRRDFKNVRNLILHQCDTKGASSGSPMLERTPNGPVVVGINVGTYIQSKVLIRNGQVARKFEARPVANTGINAAVFADFIPLLSKADILTSRDDIRAIQRRLQADDHYRGPLDGVYGANTRRSILAFQRAAGLARTGIPTRDLLDEGERQAPPLPARSPRSETRSLATEALGTLETDGIARLLQAIE